MLLVYVTYVAISGLESGGSGPGTPMWRGSACGVAVVAANDRESPADTLGRPSCKQRRGSIEGPQVHQAGRRRGPGQDDRGRVGRQRPAVRKAGGSWPAWLLLTWARQTHCTASRQEPGMKVLGPWSFHHFRSGSLRGGWKPARLRILLSSPDTSACSSALASAILPTESNGPDRLGQAALGARAPGLSVVGRRRSRAKPCRRRHPGPHSASPYQGSWGQRTAQSAVPGLQE
jgi:hypothetical protein